jgi:hypothetical protein
MICNPRPGLWVARFTCSEQFLGLGSILVEIGTDWEGWHGNLPFA